MIRHFRGIQDLSLDLDQTTVLIGENNTGKSTILDAIQIALGGFREKNRRFVGEYDHYLTKDITVEESKPIEITLYFIKWQTERWSDTLLSKARHVIQTNAENKHSIIAHVKATYNAKEGRSDVKWDFLSSNGDALLIKSAKSLLNTLVKPFALYSMRDLNQELKPSSKFWGSFLRSVNMDHKQKEEFENQLDNMNSKIIQSQEQLSEIKNQWNKIAEFINFNNDEPVSIDMLPTKISEILYKSQVSFSSITGAKIPANYHGAGTQSLIVIYLLMAYLRTKLTDKMKYYTYILTVEEPEAHLHPSASSSIIKMLSEMHRGQSITATHSGDLLMHVNVKSLRCLRRVGGKIQIHSIDTNTLNAKDRHMLEYRIKATRGNLFFARCWLLVEGESDYAVLDACASAYEIDLVHYGVYCIEYAQSPGVATVWINIARQLGIEWIMVADGDSKGRKNVKHTKRYLESNKESDTYVDARIVQLDHTLEMVLCKNGYGEFYKGRNVYESNQNYNDEYWRNVLSNIGSQKTTIALNIANKIKEIGRDGIPAPIKEIIDKVTEITGDRNDS